MKYLLLLLLTGCTIHRPVWLGDEGISEMCEKSGTYQYTHEGVTKKFTVNHVDELPQVCQDKDAYRGCIFNQQDIYVTNGNTVTCPKTMAHELSHGFGMHFVDRPQIHQGGT